MSLKPTYSVVIPVYNEEDGLEELYRQLTPILAELDGPAEVILVDDGSRDQSYPIMKAIAQRDPRFFAIKLSRNFGHQMALTAGCDYARGEATITMDADLQDPPRVILEMAKKWREGYELVFAVRRNREVDTWFKRNSALAFYHILRKLAKISAPVNSADFRLVDRKVLKAFQRLREKNRYIRGMFSWLGYKQAEVYFDRDERFVGETKYPLWKMLKLSLDAIISFSNVPLRLCMGIGLAIAGFSILLGIATIIGKVSHAGSFIVGWASLFVLISFIGGIHLFMLGILGEYLARVYDEVRNRPLYLVSDMSGTRPWSAAISPGDQPSEPYAEELARVRGAKGVSPLEPWT